MTIRVIVIGCGTMGSSHARAYHRLDGFELAGLVDRNAEARARLSQELGGIPEFDSVDAAMAAARPHAVAVCTYPETHRDLTVQALRAGMHVFVEKPIALTVEQAREIVAIAKESERKVVVGYILRHHPAWTHFIEIARSLGKPLVMRMNLNQQSKGAEWEVHKKLMQSMSPIVDCGVHYVDVMCQMTRSRPVRVHAIGARLTGEIAVGMYNYGQLQVTFADGSVGWYEAGWGPMMSETAYFVKDVIGPLGCVSIGDRKTAKSSSDINSHTKTSSLVRHFSSMDAKGKFAQKDVLIDTHDEPDHQELCNREQAYFLKAINEDLDLAGHLADAISSLRIVLAADESVRTGQVVTLGE
ncbi:MAG: gfo/Idh/MocA family oxidoreductase [Bacteroidetes bacterium]|nr:gfo/Idh/MocA family oxidoreductase [Bacteroidota bacterium]